MARKNCVPYLFSRKDVNFVAKRPTKRTSSVPTKPEQKKSEQIDTSSVDIFADEDAVEDDEHYSVCSDEQVKTALDAFKKQIEKEQSESINSSAKSFHKKVDKNKANPSSNKTYSRLIPEEDCNKFIADRIRTSFKEQSKSTNEFHQKTNVSFHESKLLTANDQFKVNENTFYRHQTAVSAKIADDNQLYTPITKNMSPADIKKLLDTYLYGLDDYKKAVSIFIWKILHGHRPKGALLVAGQSGCGKSEMFSILEKVYPLIRIANGASVVHSGYRNGRNGIMMPLFQLQQDMKVHTELKPIFVIDEFDKLIDNSRNDAHNGNMSPLTELYRLLEGDRFFCYLNDNKENVEIDTRNMAFILAGAFSSLVDSSGRPIGFSKDIHAHKAKIPTIEQIEDKLPPELRGRIEDTIFVDEFTIKDFENILRSNLYSPVHKIGKEYGIDIRARKSFIERVARESYDNGTGVRALNTSVMREVNKAIYENPQVTQLILK